MSKLFFDYLVILEEVEVEIKNASNSSEEKEELWGLVDEIVLHRVLHTIFSNLPEAHHEDFLNRFHEAPHNEGLVEYLSEKMEKDVEKIIKEEVENLKIEILKEIRKEI